MMTKTEIDAKDERRARRFMLHRRGAEAAGLKPGFKLTQMLDLKKGGL